MDVPHKDSLYSGLITGTPLPTYTGPGYMKPFKKCSWQIS